MKSLSPWTSSIGDDSPDRLALTHGSRVAVIGGGPAGAFFAYFLLDRPARDGLGWRQGGCLLETT